MNELQRITWLDHHESDEPWSKAGAEPHAALYESCGYVIFENDEIVELTNTVPRNHVGGGELFGRPLRIVKCAIRHREVLSRYEWKPA